jgi:hypothetical protein
MSDSNATTWRRRFSAGLRRHAVALISLAVALFATSYNTWRNQTTEAHRNTRTAAFMVLDALGQLQEISDRRFYGGDRSDANRIAGYGKAGVVRDMAPLISAEADADSRDFYKIWQANIDKLDANDVDAESAITRAILRTRERVTQDLRALN